MVLAVLIDGALADELKGALLSLGAILGDISANGLHVQLSEISLVLLGLQLDNPEARIVAAHLLKSAVLFGPIGHGGVHLSLGQLDGLVVQIGLHGIISFSRGRSRPNFYVFCFYFTGDFPVLYGLIITGFSSGPVT